MRFDASIHVHLYNERKNSSILKTILIPYWGDSIDNVYSMLYPLFRTSTFANFY